MSEGIVWALLAAVCWGFQGVLSKRGMGQTDVLVASWISLVSGAGLALIASAALGQLPTVAQIESGQLALLVVAGVANYTFGRTLYYASIRRIGIARASPLGAAWVVFAALLAVPLFGEPLTPQIGLGLALVFGGGLLLASR